LRRDEDSLKEWLSRQKLQRHFDKADMVELLKGQNTKTTVLLWVMWFVLNLVSYGILFSLSSPSTNSTHSDNNDAKIDLSQLVILAFVQIISSVVCFCTIDTETFGRKSLLKLAFGIGSVGCVLASITQYYILIFCVCLVQFAVSIVYCVLFPLTAEVYHSKIRSTGVGIANTFGALGGLTLSLCFVESLQSAIYLTYLVFSIAVLAGLIAACFMPANTATTELDLLGKHEDKRYQTRD